MLEKELSSVDAIGQVADVQKVRRQAIIKNSIINTIFNMLFAIIKILIGVVTNSIAILSDAINNFADAIASVVTMFGIRLSEKSPTKKHPLGFGRLEYFSGLIISGVLLITGLEFLRTSIERIKTPEVVAFTGIQFVILLVTLVGKTLLARYTIATGERVNSTALKASGKESLTDVLVSSVTILAAIFTLFSDLVIDGYVGVAVSIFILVSGISMVRETLSSIIGERTDKETAEMLISEILKYDHILGAYDLIMHNYGPTTRLATINLEMADYITVEQAYDSMQKAQREIYAKHQIFFVFGLYAVNTYDEEIKEMNTVINNILRKNKHVVDIHAFNVDKDSKKIRFDVTVDFDVKDYALFEKTMVTEIQNIYETYTVDMNIDLDYA